jgi:sugar (pentulose or hexulose) kinase
VADRAIITLDIGKTHAKLTLWDVRGVVLERRSRANTKLDNILDAAGIEEWLTATLTEFAKLANVGAIIPVAHGAAAALVNGGKLVCPPRDYEAPIPPDIRASYDRLRAPFADTGSPALPNGLNLGAQLFAQSHLFAETKEKTQILLWPQYWSWLLSGVASSEVTSLGTHSDLWDPAQGSFSGLVDTLVWTNLFPPLRYAGDVLGPITPDWVARTGLSSDTQIHCGVHDSNAALVAARGYNEVARREATILSTGTWFIAMRSSAEPVNFHALPEARDCFVNVDVEGRPVPSARFMGGREIEILGERIDQPGLEGLADVIANKAMILPGFVQGCGPFPTSVGKWLKEPGDPVHRRVAIALYAALVSNVALNLIGAKDCILIEGRFAEAEIFVRALASLRPGDAIYTASGETDVSFGALRLVNPALKADGALMRAAKLDQDISDYRNQWHSRIV